MDKILKYIALRDILAEEDSPVLNPDRREEISAVATAAIYIFTSKFPELFNNPVIPEAAEPKPELPQHTRSFVLMMLDEFVACHTLATLYGATDPEFAETQRRRAADVVESLSCLCAPMSVFG